MWQAQNRTVDVCGCEIYNLQAAKIIVSGLLMVYNKEVIRTRKAIGSCRLPEIGGKHAADMARGGFDFHAAGLVMEGC